MQESFSCKKKPVSGNVKPILVWETVQLPVILILKSISNAI
jgi:hypothetical protein